MKPLHEKWLQSLAKDKIIENFDTSFGKYYRLVSAHFYIPEEIIQLLKKVYHPGFEKGGFFLASPEKKNNSVFLVIRITPF